jgi:hypothetical protein
LIDLRKRRGFFLTFFFAALGFLQGETRWYQSNAAGMALESAYSRLALRGKYALSIAVISPGELPEILREYHNGDYTIELRTLYEDGELSRRQWLFKDSAGVTRLTAAFNSNQYIDSSGIPAAETPAAFIWQPDTAPPDEAAPPPGAPPPDETALPAAVPEEAAPAGDTAGEETGSAEAGTEEASEEAEEAPDQSGFIELYGSDGLITEEHQIDPQGKDQITAYIYNNQLLLRAEARIKTPKNGETEETIEDYYTDYYRYSRSYSLRSVERVFRSAASAVPAEERIRLAFPHMILGAARDFGFVSPGSAYGSDFFEDVLLDSGFRVLYTTDDRGRVLTETRRDEEGNVIGELQNTWSGDRLVRVRWLSGEDERVTEYEYDAEGDRILERNSSRGILERTIRREGDRDVEELYMNGKVILRAIWEDGRKISEVRVSSPGAGETPPAETPPAEGVF